eukprot:15479955-Alexandrium_andersonii.AAC.1
MALLKTVASLQRLATLCYICCCASFASRPAHLPLLIASLFAVIANWRWPEPLSAEAQHARPTPPPRCASR